MLYFGPEVLVPLASAAAAVGGFFLLTWRKIMGLFRKLVGAPMPEEPAVMDAQETEPQDTHV